MSSLRCKDWWPKKLSRETKCSKPSNLVQQTPQNNGTVRYESYFTDSSIYFNMNPGNFGHPEHGKLAILQHANPSIHRWRTSTLHRASRHVATCRQLQKLRGAIVFPYPLPLVHVLARICNKLLKPKSELARSIPLFCI